MSLWSWVYLVIIELVSILKPSYAGNKLQRTCVHGIYVPLDVHDYHAIYASCLLRSFITLISRVERKIRTQTKLSTNCSITIMCCTSINLYIRDITIECCIVGMHLWNDKYILLAKVTVYRGRTCSSSCYITVGLVARLH